MKSYHLECLIIAFLCIVSLLSCSRIKRQIHKDTTGTAKRELKHTPKNLDGIDVSHHQGKVDWEAVAKDGRVQYVYLKATEGATVTDSRYKQNILNARKAGFKVSAYHYMTMTSSARAQFENFKRTVGKDIDLLPMLDLEPSRHKNPLAKIRQKADSLMILIEDYYGVKPILYCTQDRYYIICDDDYKLTQPYHILAKYQSYPLYWGQYSSAAPKFASKNNCVIWQYSDKKRLKGFRGTLDFSCFINGHGIKDILMH